MEEAGSIYAFINFKQAARFGHVAWGFSLEDGTYYFGSSDHLWKHDWWDLFAWCNYMHVPENGDIDWWAQRGSKNDMLSEMKSGRHIRYHAYKEIVLAEVNPQNALQKAMQLKSSGWNLYTNNCVHQAFLVFSQYKSEHGLPDPFADPLNLIPKTWFARIEAEAISL